MGYNYGYDVSYDVGNSIGAGLGAVFGFLIFIYIISLAVGIFTIVCNWKVYKKAGKNGWEAIIPVYNIVVLLQIVELPLWYIALFFVPFANIYATFKIYIELAKKFGQSTGFGIGLVFLNPIFMAMLAFGKSYVYTGVATTNAQQPMMNQNYNNQYNNQGYNNQYNNFNQAPTNTQPYNNQPMGQPVASQPVQANNCSRCGAPVNPGDRFCMSCGNQL